MMIGLVGLGRMGGAISQRLKERGFEVLAYDRSAAAMERHRQRGFAVAPNPLAVAQSADVVISIITEDKGVRAVFMGADGFLSGDVAGKLFIEMSTLRPATHRELAPLVKARGAAMVDSPVMGSIPTVREGKLLALLGGEAQDVARARVVLEHLTRRIEHLGPNGAGCAMKLCVNLGMAVYMQSLAEALCLGASEGLSRDKILDILGESPIISPFFQSKVPVLKGESADVTLDVRTLRKDVMSAVYMGAGNGVSLPAASGALASLSAAVAMGYGEKDLAEAALFFCEHMPQKFD